ncbi:MAG: hypothetical protein GY714_28335 [Desulfobacterales bacterium]|nr:hypothetical protein [Desulfobacterales bacterium]MCP4161885.1 hypothetical protein [Deltaproteobacteria bacterium]
MKNKTIELKINENITVFEKLTLKVTDVIFEEVEPEPDSDSYPEGSGVNVYLLVKSGGESKKITLLEITKPYESILSKEWKNYRFKLLEVTGYQNPVVKLSIQQLNN